MSEKNNVLSINLTDAFDIRGEGVTSNSTDTGFKLSKYTAKFKIDPRDSVSVQDNFKLMEMYDAKMKLIKKCLKMLGIEVPLTGVDGGDDAKTILTSLDIDTSDINPDFLRNFNAATLCLLLFNQEPGKVKIFLQKDVMDRIIQEALPTTKALYINIAKDKIKQIIISNFGIRERNYQWEESNAPMAHIPFLEIEAIKSAMRKSNDIKQKKSGALFPFLSMMGYNEDTPTTVVGSANGVNGASGGAKIKRVVKVKKFGKVKKSVKKSLKVRRTKTMNSVKNLNKRK